MPNEDERDTIISPDEVKAVVAAVSTLDFVLKKVALSKSNLVDLRVSVQSGEKAAITVTLGCYSDSEAGLKACEDWGNRVQDLGGYACASVENGVECTVTT